MNAKKLETPTTSGPGPLSFLARARTEKKSASAVFWACFATFWNHRSTLHLSISISPGAAASIPSSGCAAPRLCSAVHSACLLCLSSYSVDRIRWSVEDGRRPCGSGECEGGRRERSARPKAGIGAGRGWSDSLLVLVVLSCSPPCEHCLRWLRGCGRGRFERVCTGVGA